MCIQTGKTINDKDRMIYAGDYSVKTEEEMRKLFPSLPEAFDNTQEVADKCSFKFKFAKGPSDYRMPKVHIPEEFGTDYFGYMEALAREGFEKRYPKVHVERNEAEARLNYELEVIKKMGFAEYFLDTLKTIQYSHSQGWLTGPGRGSAAGSVMCYCLGITEIDPVRYDLLFERFLNPERVSMPKNNWAFNVNPITQGCVTA
jgi:DNA polymerase-3 subunit alpha